MIFETVVVGPLGVNCFILGCLETKEGVVVDPGGDTDAIRAAIARLGLKVRFVINTHGHFDHVGGNAAIVAATGAELLIHEADAPWLSKASSSAAMYGMSSANSPQPDHFLEEGMSLLFGRHGIRVIHTPGHTAGGCSLYLEGEGIVITGDTLFAESVGRTDLAGGSHETLMESIKGKLLTLPADTRVYPGHGPSTTIGHERRHNPYLTGGGH